jgi:hypothetical protein
MVSPVKPIIQVYLESAKVVALEFKQATHTKFSTDCWEFLGEIGDPNAQLSENLKPWQWLNSNADESIHFMLLGRY